MMWRFWTKHVLPTPQEAEDHTPTSDERVTHAIAHIGNMLRQRFDGTRELDVEVHGLDMEEQFRVGCALRDAGWWIEWRVEGQWPTIVSVRVRLRARRSG